MTYVDKDRQWKIRSRGDALGRMYYAHPSSGECFYLCLLLTVVTGSTSFNALRTFEDVEYPTFKEACIAQGLLEDDGEWISCLTDASYMQMGRQLRSLFVTILTHGNPTFPLDLWERFREHICDDLAYNLRRKGIANPTDEQVSDYGLYLMEKSLRQQNSSLTKFPPMPMSQIDWDHEFGNHLILEQKDYDIEEQKQKADERIPMLNEDLSLARASFYMVQVVQEKHLYTTPFAMLFEEMV